MGTVSLAISSWVNIVRANSGLRKRPNILFFFTDDQRFDTIAALGNDRIITPNMDSLVRSGTTFTNAYIMGSMSGAVSVPSRAMLMTGRTLFHLKGTGGVIPSQHTTLPEVLRGAGYKTFVTGKWHQDKKTLTRCFSAGSKIFFGGMDNHWKIAVNDFDPTGNYPKKQQYRGDKHSSELFSDAAIQFLQDHKDNKPFFVYIAYTAPHDPRQAPEKYKQMYKPEEIDFPKNFLPEHPFDNGEMKIRDEKLACWPRTPDEIRKHIADYYAIITHVDAQMGRVLRVLNETGLDKNTIIVFASDNGLAVGRHGLMGKQNLYEHSVHVPLIIGGPGIPKGQKIDGFCYLLDIFPTLCELTGVPIPESVEGRSLAALILGQKSRIRDSIFFAYKDVQQGVRDKRYKLIEYKVEGKRTTQLFDLESDPFELENLADNPAYVAQLKRLRRELLRWKEETDDGSKFWQDYDIYIR
jgi:arylsulfatase A-like enzyme